MKLDNVKQSAERLNRLIDGWHTNGTIPRIERDIALDELRKLYDQLLDIEECGEQQQTSDTMAAVAPVAGVVVAQESNDETDSADATEPDATESEAEQSVVEDEPVATNDAEVENVESEDDNILDIDALLGLSAPAAVATATEAVAAEEVAQTTAEEVVVAPAEEEIVEAAIEPKPVADTTMESGMDSAASTTGELFAMDDIPVAKRGGRTMISLYNTASRSVAVPEATIDDEPTTPAVESETQPKRLVDVLGGDRVVLAEKMAAEERPTTPFNRITDLRKAIGINDKFLMIKDLFGGNAAQYEATIDILNEFEDLDDCMIYIVENFSWNPDSEGAKLLVSLIERKLS